MTERLKGARTTARWALAFTVLSAFAGVLVVQSIGPGGYGSPLLVIWAFALDIFGAVALLFLLASAVLHFKAEADIGRSQHMDNEPGIGPVRGDLPRWRGEQLLVWGALVSQGLALARVWLFDEGIERALAEILPAGVVWFAGDYGGVVLGALAAVLLVVYLALHPEPAAKLKMRPEWELDDVEPQEWPERSILRR